MRTSRTKKQYIDGVEAFIKYVVHNLQKIRNIDPRGNKQQLMMPCPCTTCLNHIEHKVEEVMFYLFKYEIDLSYTKWDKHREKVKQATTAQIPINTTTEFVDDTDFNIDFGSEISTYGPATVEIVNAIKESFDEDDFAKFQELLLDAEKPLYKGCLDFTKLSAIVKLLNLKGKYGPSDKFFTELLGFFKKDEPLVDDLHTLFKIGVDTYDASTKENFNLCVVVLWTINDYPVLGTLCGYPYSGFKGCVVCGKDTYYVRLSASSKQSYAGYRRYLPYNHPFRRQKKVFNGQQEFQLAPNPLTGEQIYNEVERELAISKYSVSETVRWISYGPRATIVKYEEYNKNGYTFCTKRNDGIVYQNSGVSVEAVDLHISKEVVTTRKAFYYGVLQEIWVLDYRFRQISLFKCDWVNDKAGGVKHNPNLGYTLVDLNSLGHKDDPFILASQARQVFYVNDQIDKKFVYCL
nr:hypothetical protein [Tanacetum cinerariifolium]